MSPETVLTVEIQGLFFRVADPDWRDPLDPDFAARGDGQRWNPPGLACLYLNRDDTTARANVRRLFQGLPYGPEDLDPATAPVLVELELPAGRAVDAFDEEGLRALGLPPTYPLDDDGEVVPHSVCQPVGQAAFDRDLDGIDCRSAAPGGTRELAWFPRRRQANELSRRTFAEWW